MKKIVAIILTLSFMMAFIPMSVSGTTLTFLEDENIAAQDYMTDTIIFSQTDAPNSMSSGGANRWNSFTGRDTHDGIADPLDSTNTISRHFANYNNGNESVLKKSFGIPTEGEFVWEFNMMIAPPKEGDYPLTIRTEILGNITTFTHTNGANYIYSIGPDNQTGTVRAGEWMRFTAYVQCGNDGLEAEDTAIYFTTVLPDNTIIRQTTIGIPTDISFQYGITMTEGSIGGFYLDDVYLYIPGDFGPTKIDTEASMDIHGNYPLNGKVTLSLYHRVDPSRVVPDNLKLYNEKGNPVHITDVTWNATRPDRIILDFTGHPLEKNTLYTLVIPENTADVTGKLIKETELSFQTYGSSGDWRERVEIVKETPGGYVMPDPYNTGYRCDKSELVDFYTKYPDFDPESSEIIITETLAHKYNYEFSHFILDGASIKVIATSPVYIHDALLKNSGIQNGRSGRVGSSSRLTIAWCEGDGSSGDFFGGGNLTISHCYIHDSKADHMKGWAGQIVEFNYFRDGGTRSPGAHADVVQFMGSAEAVQNDMRFYGNRFDVPQLGYEHVANCAFFFKPEKNTQGYSNVQAIGNWFNGGGYTMYISPAGGTYQLKYLTYQNNKLGCGYAFSTFVTNIDNIEALGDDQLVYEGNELMQTLQAGSIVYYNADGKRVYNASEMTGNGSVMVNFANYVAEAKDYRIEVNIVDANDNPLGTYTKEGNIIRYTPYKEYFTNDNQEVIGTFTDSSGTHNIVQLINLPNLPHDVPETISLENLPTDMTGCRIEVTVYDTTNEDVVIRTGALTNEVLENHRMPGVEYPKTLDYAYSEDRYESNWAGMSLEDILSDGGIAWNTDGSANVSVSENGVITFIDMTRDNIHLDLSDKVSEGIARLAFDLYFDSETAADTFKFTLGGRTLFSIAEDGTVSADRHTLHMTDGWNTIELLLFPYTEEGVLSTSDNTKVMHNDIYLCVTPGGQRVRSYALFDKDIQENYVLIDDFITNCHLSEANIALGYENNSNTIQIANLSASNLISDATFYEITVKRGNETQIIYMPTMYQDRTYTLPSGAGTWLYHRADNDILQCLSAGDTLQVDSSLLVYHATEFEMQFVGANATLGSEMVLNLKLASDILPFATTEFTVFANNTALKWANTAETDENGHFNIPLSGIQMADMAHDMSLYVLVERDGVYYISEKATEYSLLKYIETLYTDSETDDTLSKLLVSMLQFASAAESSVYHTDIIKQAANDLGITFSTDKPKRYTNKVMTSSDKATLNELADTSIDFVTDLGVTFTLKNPTVTSMRATCGSWTKTYQAKEGIILFSDMHAAAIQSVYTLDFLDSDNSIVESVKFVVGNILTTYMDQPVIDNLARTGIFYMIQARAYLLKQAKK